MAIETRDDFDLRPDFAIQREEPLAPHEVGTFWNVAAAGGRRQNFIPGLFGPPTPNFEAEPGFDPLTKEELKGYEPWAERLATSNSRAESGYRKQKIDRELADQKMISQAGWGGALAEMAGGLTNPVLWFGYAAGPAGWAGLASTIGRVALAAAGSEVVLQSQQETRAWEESAVNVAASALVVGVLGGAGQLLSKRAAGGVADGVIPPAKEPPFIMRGEGLWEKPILNSKGVAVGTVDGRIDTAANELVVRNQSIPNPGDRGEGLSGKAWKEVVDYALDSGMAVRSDASVTAAAARPYEKLGSGYVVTKNPNAVSTVIDVDGKPMTVWKSEAPGIPVFRVTKAVDEKAAQAANVERAAIIKQAADDIKAPGGALEREVVPTNVNARAPDDFGLPPPVWTPETMGSKIDVPDAVAKHLSYGNPLVRLMTSVANTTRSVAESLLEMPMYLRKNREGLPTEHSLETLIKVDGAPTGEALQATRDAFNKSQGFPPGEINFIRARMKAGWGGEHAFKQAVGRALRNGDVSDDPLVAAVARTWRTKVFDPLKERAMKLELFPEQKTLRKELTALEKQGTKEGLSDELTASIAAKTKELKDWVPDPKGADSYLTRLYNYQKLATEADDFRAAVAQYLRAAEGYTEAEAKKTAKAIHAGLLTKDNMFGVPKPEFRGPGRITSQAGGALRERTVTLPDNILEPWLISDVEHAGRTYTRRMSTEINLAEKFGDRSMKDQVQAIKLDYEALVEAATSKKDKLALHDALRADVRDIEAMRDQFIGTYGLPSDPSGLFARGNRTARSWQYVVALGMQTVSALPDMARGIVTNGMSAYAKGLVHALPLMAKMAKEDVKRMGIGLDMLTSGRMRAIASMDEIPGVGGKFDHAMEELASGFGKVSLMDPWNSYWKQYTGVMAVDRIAQMAERGWVKLGAAERAQLNWLGIDANSLNGIRGQFAKHGTKDSGFNVANIASWDHDHARTLMAAATKEADTLIITPGKGDKSLLAATDVGKTLLQFQSFTAAATNRMLISGIAQGDMKVVQGLFMGITIGALGAYTKDTINGRPVNWANDPTLLVARGLRQMGGLGLIAQIPVDMATAAYEKKPVGKAMLDTIPGVNVPAEGLLRATAGAMSAAQKGEGAKAAKEASKLSPYQNLFYLRQLFNEMGDGERSAIGLKRPAGKDGPAQSGSSFGG